MDAKQYLFSKYPLVSPEWFDDNELTQEMIKMMDGYHESKLKEELIEYDKWLTQQYWGCEIPTPDHSVEQYLKQR